MADILLTTDTTTQQTLTSASDFYFLQEGVLHTSTSLKTLEIDAAATDANVFVNGTMANFSTGTIHDTGGPESVAVIVSDTGKIQSIQQQRGIELDGDLVLISNAGTIIGGEAIRLGGEDARIYNTGLIASVFSTSLTNIDTIIMEGDRATLVNAGEITGATTISLFDSFEINNSGIIIAQTKAINAALSSSETGYLVNSGTISTAGEFAYDGASADETIDNSGTIIGRIDLSFGDNTIVNSGAITGDITTEIFSTNNLLINSGTITGDVLFLGTTGETVSNSGTITGIVNFSSGADSYTGSGNGFVSVEVFGGDGNDTLRGGQMDDQLAGGNDVDILFGGSGNDDLSGGNDADVISGNSGEDVLKGGAGIDKLLGGKGNDDIIGGADRDNLFGGNGADVFDFNNVSDSTNGATDAIRDFVRGVDVIDLVDTTGLNILFNDTSGFLGGGDASLYYSVNGKGQAIVRVDTDGDAVEDMRIQVNNTAVLGLEDFAL